MLHRCTLNKIKLKAVVGSLTSILVTSSYSVELKNSVWTVQIEPKSLEVRMFSSDKTDFVLSKAQEIPENPLDIKEEETKVSWAYAENTQKIEFRLEDDLLVMETFSENPSEITWPVLDLKDKTSALILPRLGGLYIPSQDAFWLEYLAEDKDMDTIYHLTMPFFGLEIPGHTVTYFADCPAWNNLYFEKKSDKQKDYLNLSLTHRFIDLCKEKRFQMMVKLGNSSSIEPALTYRNWLIKKGQWQSLKEKEKIIPNVSKLYGALHAYLWGDGMSKEMFEKLKQSGIDHACFGYSITPSEEQKNCKKSNSDQCTCQDAMLRVEAIKSAKDLGYLVAPYDSYHSIHSPSSKPDDTWITAQFDHQLFEAGPVVGKDNKKLPGFNDVGYILSPKAAFPYVQKRVSDWHKDSGYNAWFFDCDAAGGYFDDYSPKHTCNQMEEIKERQHRCVWTSEKIQGPIGSEGGASSMMSSIHFTHGVFDGPRDWFNVEVCRNIDRETKKKKEPSSEYFRGVEWRPCCPASYMKPVKIMEYSEKRLYSPEYRIPLFQTVFHDSVIATHHWTMPSLKFPDLAKKIALFEIFYCIPPLYHLSLKEFEKHRETIFKQCKIFSPLHKEVVHHSITAFEWLTSDRKVQKMTFGDHLVEIVANFSESAFQYAGESIPSLGALILKKDGTKIIYN